MDRKWEYKLVTLPRPDDLPRRSVSTSDQIETLLDGYGEQGWELCGIEYGSFIFKREKSES